MSDETEVVPEPKKTNPTVQLAGLVLAVILAFALLVWAQGIRISAVRRESFGRGIDGLSAALMIPIVETSSLRNPNRLERLQSIVEDIQRKGNYQVVTVTDATGKVLASTDAGQKNQTLKEMAEAQAPAKEKEANGLIEATTAVTSKSGEKIGAIRVIVKL
ncbi:MAG: hypothetical protein JNM34_02045 [Chthonomonadaceae bacterium]|jgi:DNA integrity scanning protein DisA with diadenylate cyclase activity|nr:hypothetical protein [Chthonomonadaceae bacterium]